MEAILLLALAGEPTEKAVPFVPKLLLSAPEPVLYRLGYKAGYLARKTNYRLSAPIFT